MKRAIAAFCLAASALPALADSTQLNLSASAQREVANDQIQASLYVQDNDNQPARLADRLNKALNQGLAAGRGYKHVELASGGYNSWPSYDKGGKIKGWQGRAELTLKSRDFAEAAELIGKLQQNMLLSGVNFGVSAEARKAAEQAMIPEAIAALKTQAGIAAQALGKNHVEIKELDIGRNEPIFRPLMMKAMGAPMAAADSVATPDFQPGRSQLQLQISGKVELK